MDDAWTGPTVGQLGELAVLDRIVRRLPAGAPDVGPGDDCAVVAAPDGRFVVTTDMMVHGPDFRWAWSSPADVGWKAAATNLSDVAAMGATPSGLVIALAAPQETPVAVLESFADGVRAAVDALSPGCGVVGGDLSTSAVFTVSVTAFGDLGGRAPVLRSSARPGDVLAVSGELGRAARGLARLFRDGVDAHGEPSRSATVASGADTDPDVDRQRRPVPPIADGPLAATAGATAMLDLSDGLAIDAGRLARASRVTLDLDADGVAGADDLALHGGEDHGLLATFPPGVALPGGFRRIGAVVARGGADLVRGGEPVPTTGWDPYADWDGAAG
ncbi:MULTISPECIES: thiamine-phosphate kinase [unclassified Curtobacterium]|uniref:thiamine-phosphate kinase n=1 Tax=unclassified Curtobacterium TaxID=257496 RepID=UPI00052A6621|nr:MULTISPECIES: thiamine-phosphate kinase [unclassified Curtobacterium]AIV41530.1 thiamine-monophosphate kinase [Curtobacterium sp. MR_MD2014]